MCLSNNAIIVDTALNNKKSLKFVTQLKGFMKLNGLWHYHPEIGGPNPRWHTLKSITLIYYSHVCTISWYTHISKLY